ncbi:uncharacterized protein AMSG_10360 [Thecamonas trahens ATCC 50062]|uniref:Uncharacterized protein n=1 Tax=Thecamonas trahens ATCC 50062 TaxID=461836 RepID=A0A0L0DR72_THETB|nr:hypothetical protein AMSG_10360 [Thecamonas trahens ATCC 50062]KNC54516.1 hypothetical protein AMSG_10360 [Thecamonas trahens ATCC 50062]|eukprot:XP_013753534.1 hypothetical protein AMSG_10360 [Thecamonas trahens ATCC 50062]
MATDPNHNSTTNSSSGSDNHMTGSSSRFNAVDEELTPEEIKAFCGTQPTGAWLLGATVGSIPLLALSTRVPAVRSALSKPARTLLIAAGALAGGYLAGNSAKTRCERNLRAKKRLHHAAVDNSDVLPDMGESPAS